MLLIAASEMMILKRKPFLILDSKTKKPLWNSFCFSYGKTRQKTNCFKYINAAVREWLPLLLRKHLFIQIFLIIIKVATNFSNSRFQTGIVYDYSF